MSLDTDGIDVLTFDSFSTLVDVEAAASVLEGIADDPAAIASLWRSRAVMYSLLAGPLDQYTTYSELHRYGLEFAATVHDLSLTDAEIAEINEIYFDLPPFDDVLPTVEQLYDAGYDLYIITNGEPAMVRGLLDSTQIGNYITDTISAHELKTFKPNAALYQRAAERANATPSAMAHVSAAVFDVRGAQQIGMQGVWLNRAGHQTDPFGEQPTSVVESLHELADILSV